MDPDAREILDQLGLSHADEGLLDCEPPLAVDREKVRAYLDKSLSPSEQGRIRYLLGNYKAWNDVRRELIIERAQAESAIEKVTALVFLQRLMRQRMLMVAMASCLILLVGVFLWSGSGKLSDGTNLVAYRDGSVTGLEEYGQDWTTRAETVFGSGISDVVVLEDIDNAMPQVRGGSKSKVLLHPYGIAVRDTKPLFSWIPFEGIEDYSIEVRDIAKDQEVGSPFAVQGVKREYETQIDAELERGLHYEWRLNYDQNGVTRHLPRTKDQLSAVFYVLSANEMETLQEAERQVSDSHLLRFLLYVEYGLLQEAQAELDLLMKENPDSDLANTLLQHWKEFLER